VAGSNASRATRSALVPRPPVPRKFPQLQIPRVDGFPFSQPNAAARTNQQVHQFAVSFRSESKVWRHLARRADEHHRPTAGLHSTQMILDHACTSIPGREPACFRLDAANPRPDLVASALVLNRAAARFVLRSASAGSKGPPTANTLRASNSQTIPPAAHSNTVPQEACSADSPSPFHTPPAHSRDRSSHQPSTHNHPTNVPKASYASHQSPGTKVVYPA
jgi:hypothetical protein